MSRRKRGLFPSRSYTSYTYYTYIISIQERDVEQVWCGAYYLCVVISTRFVEMVVGGQGTRNWLKTSPFSSLRFYTSNTSAWPADTFAQRERNSET